MPQHPLHSLHVGPGAHGQTRRRVPKVMRSDRRERLVGLVALTHRRPRSDREPPSGGTTRRADVRELRTLRVRTIPPTANARTDLNMRGDGGDEASAFSRDGSPIAGGLFGQSSFATYAIARQGNTVALPK